MTSAFRAMNTDVTVMAPYLKAAREREHCRQVQALFEHTESVFSRFRADSELSRLNGSVGRVVVSREMFQALERANSYWELTDGWFDPTIAPALAALGYDRSFVPGAFDRATSGVATQAAVDFRSIRLDSASVTVCMPSGVNLDCGGFIKGWAVDRASELLPVPSAVDAGGDVRLRGGGPDGDGWLVGIEDPTRPGVALMEFRVRDRGVATSGTSRRHWRVGPREVHHLIDPATGAPATSDLAQVTVIAASVELADVLAKTAFMRGAVQGRAFVERFPDVSAVFVLCQGEVRICGELEGMRTLFKHDPARGAEHNNP